MKKHSSVALVIILSIASLVAYGARNTPTALLHAKVICPDCNVLIIGLDALQAAHVSHLGYATSTTPTVDSLASKGTSFGNAISAAPWTVPSFMSMMTGLFPTEHKVVNKFSVFTKEKQEGSNLKKLSPQVETLAQTFKANGYATGGFTGDAGVSGSFGYAQGFDVYTDEKAFGSIGNSSDHALTWIKEHKNERLFVFLHGYDDHGQFDLPKDYKGRFTSENYKGPYKGTKEEQRNLREQGLAQGSVKVSPADVSFWRSWYDSKIRDQDDRLAVFLKEYDRLGLLDKTIIVVVSDHGTEFFEHKRMDHGFSLYDELVHVPLLFVVPGLTNKPVIHDQVTSLDIAPTLLELTGIKASTQFLSQLRGTSLVPYLVSGTGTPQDVFMETDYRDYTHKRGLRTADGWKYVLTMETGKEELYNLNTDPQELNNVLLEHADLAKELKARVEKHIADMGANVKGPWHIGCVPVYGDQCK